MVRSPEATSGPQRRARAGSRVSSPSSSGSAPRFANATRVSSVFPSAPRRKVLVTRARPGASRVKTASAPSGETAASHRRSLAASPQNCPPNRSPRGYSAAVSGVSGLGCGTSWRESTPSFPRMTVARFSRAPTRVKTSSSWSFLSVTSSEAGSSGMSATGGSHDRGEAGSTAGASAVSEGCAGPSGAAGISAVTGVCVAGFFGGAGMKNCVHTSTSATISTMASSWFRCIFLSCSSSNNRCSP